MDDEIIKRDKLISVVVPIYNVECYLKKCLDAIINQTYENLEIILVDDGSTDSSGLICEKYAKMDKRIVVYHKENGGLSDARNYGTRRSRGDYLFYVDSDDYISRDCIERLYANIIRFGAEISTVGFIEFDEKEKPKPIYKKAKVYTAEKAIEKMLYQRKCTNSAWGKLYKKELFNDIEYPVGVICEDLPVTYRVFSKANRIAIDQSRLYYYLQRSSSIIHQTFKSERMVTVDFIKEQSAYIKEHYPNITKSAANRAFMEAIFIKKNMNVSGVKIPRSFIRKVDELMRKNRNTVFLDPRAPIKSKIYVALSYIGKI